MFLIFTQKELVWQSYYQKIDSQSQKILLQIKDILKIKRGLIHQKIQKIVLNISKDRAKT